jgi:hypothetical protein
MLPVAFYVSINNLMFSLPVTRYVLSLRAVYLHRFLLAFWFATSTRTTDKAVLHLGGPEGFAAGMIVRERVFLILDRG